MNKQIKCLILDDDPGAIDVLKFYIAKTSALSLVASYRNSVTAFEFLNANKMDLLFLDIEMPLINGLKFLASLRNPPATIFTTAYRDFAVEGFELKAVDYLLKPFSYDRFLKAVERVNEKHRYESNRLVLKDGKGFITIDPAEIVFVESNRDYIKIVTLKDSKLVHLSLKKFSEMLDPAIFVQVHRSYIINTKLVTKFDSEELELMDQHLIRIGRLYRDQLDEKIKNSFRS